VVEYGEAAFFLWSEIRLPYGLKDAFGRVPTTSETQLRSSNLPERFD
jgi:hypothetical protein